MAKHKTMSTYKLGEKVSGLLHDEPGGDGDGLHAAVPLQQEPVLHVAQLHELALLAEGTGAAMCRMLDNVSSVQTMRQETGNTLVNILGQAAGLLVRTVVPGGGHEGGAADLLQHLVQVLLGGLHRGADQRLDVDRGQHLLVRRQPAQEP